MDPKKILVLSDTHIKTNAGVEKLDGVLQRHAPKADLIVHAGDIVSYPVLDYLRTLAPVRAVYGNMDGPEIKNEFGLIDTFDLNGKRFGVTHGHRFLTSPRGGAELTRYSRFQETFGTLDCVIFGHTHQAFNQVIDGLLMFNPGSATDKRFSQRYSLGIIEVGEEIEARIVYFEK